MYVVALAMGGEYVLAAAYCGEELATAEKVLAC